MVKSDQTDGQTSCKQCGICCTKGGPALHVQDLELLQSGVLPLEKLITIRKGELVHNPLKDGIYPATIELVKIGGKPGAWTCVFFDEVGKNCNFYQNRPYSCRVLKCWQPHESLELIEQGTISRFEIMKEDDPVRKLVATHDESCPNPDFLLIQKGEISGDDKRKVEELVQQDLAIRTEAVKQFGLSLQLELFYFGRPMFQLLSSLGVKVVQGQAGVQLQW